MPCTKFVLVSSGYIQKATPNKLGEYYLAPNFLYNDRLVYVRKTPFEIFNLMSDINPDTREHHAWMVRYAILIKHPIF